jgi:hypothetical protein
MWISMRQTTSKDLWSSASELESSTVITSVQHLLSSRIMLVNWKGSSSKHLLKPPCCRTIPKALYNNNPMTIAENAVCMIPPSMKPGMPDIIHTPECNEDSCLRLKHKWKFRLVTVPSHKFSQAHSCRSLDTVSEQVFAAASYYNPTGMIITTLALAPTHTIKDYNGNP